MLSTEKQGVVDIVCSDDPLAGDHVEPVAQAFESCLNFGQPMVVYDMAHVPLLDSAGLEMLLDVLERFNRAGGDLKLANVNQLCHDILQATGVDVHFESFNNRTDAVGSFSK